MEQHVCSLAQLYLLVLEGADNVPATVMTQYMVYACKAVWLCVWKLTRSYTTRLLAE